MSETEQFRQFYDKYYYYAFAIASKYIPLKEDIEDVLSEVFIALYKMFPSIDLSHKTKALVFTITKRKVNDFLRKKYRMAAREIIMDSESLDYLNTESKDPETEGENHINVRNILTEMVQELDEIYHDLFELRYVRNQAFNDVAEGMGITTNYAKVLNNRLITKLQESWKNTSEIL